MPQSLFSLLIHLVFTTKNREPCIRGPIDTELFAYSMAVMENLRCPVLAINGMADHVHVLFNMASVVSLAEVVEELKTSTSKWIKTKGPTWHKFHWQSGYAAFSVSQSNVDVVVSYVREQERHHHGLSCQDEFRALLNKHGIAFDERYLWD